VYLVHFLDDPKALNCVVRKHMFPVFRRPRQDFVGEGLLLTFRSGFRGRFILLSAFLEHVLSLFRAGGPGLVWCAVIRLFFLTFFFILFVYLVFGLWFYVCSHFLFFKAPNYMLARTLTERIV